MNLHPNFKEIWLTRTVHGLSSRIITKRDNTFLPNDNTTSASNRNQAESPMGPYWIAMRSKFHKRGLNLRISEKIGQDSSQQKSGFLGLTGAFSGPIGAFPGPIRTNSSAPHSCGGSAAIAPTKAFLVWFALFGPSPPLLSPRSDFMSTRRDRYRMLRKFSPLLVHRLFCWKCRLCFVVVPGSLRNNTRRFQNSFGMLRVTFRTTFHFAIVNISRRFRLPMCHPSVIDQSSAT